MRVDVGIAFLTKDSADVVDILGVPGQLKGPFDDVLGVHAALKCFVAVMNGPPLPLPSPALKPVDSLNFQVGTLANLVDSLRMTLIIFRELPAVAAVERQLDLHARGHLLDDELEELPHLIDDASIELFGIAERDTFYWALPASVRGQYGRLEWEEQFAALGRYTRDPNAHWKAFGLDLRCPEGRGLHCLEVFGRQLVCALNGIHPQAGLAFAHRETAKAA
jgi:hypothetical protein